MNASIRAMALGVVADVELDATGTQMRFGTGEGPVLADHDTGDVVQQHGARAHVAGRQRRIQRRSAVVGGAEAPGLLQAVHLGMQHGAALLDALVVAAADDRAVDDEHRPDRDAAGVEPGSRFGDRSLEEGVVRRGQAMASSMRSNTSVSRRSITGSAPKFAST